MKPLDQYSEVVDVSRRWVPDWYSWLLDVDNRASSPVTNIVTVNGASSLNPTMNGGIVLLNGNAFYSFTIPDPLTFPNTFACRIVNDDVGRGKKIVAAVPGTADFPANFILWPKQVLFLFNTTNHWHTDPDVNKGGMRWKLDAANTNFYINESLGNDGNDGLATGAGAFKTPQGFFDQLITALDVNGQVVSMQFDDGTFTNGLVIRAMWTGSGTLGIRGNASNPTNVVWTISSAGSTGGACVLVTAFPGGNVVIENIKAKSTVAGASVFQILASSSIQFRGMTFDGASTNPANPGTILTCQFAGSFMNVTTPCTITGDAGTFAVANGGGTVNMGGDDGAGGGNTITLGGTGIRTFNQFMFASSSSTIDARAIYKNAAGKKRSTKTGNTHSNTTLDGLATTSDLSNGMVVTGTDIPAGTTITIASGTSVTLSAAATATTTGGTYKFEIARGTKFIVQNSSFILGLPGAGVDYLPGDVPGIAINNGFYQG